MSGQDIPVVRIRCDETSKTIKEVASISSIERARLIIGNPLIRDEYKSSFLSLLKSAAVLVDESYLLFDECAEIKDEDQSLTADYEKDAKIQDSESAKINNASTKLLNTVNSIKICEGNVRRNRERSSSIIQELSNDKAVNERTEAEFNERKSNIVVAEEKARCAALELEELKKASPRLQEKRRADDLVGELTAQAEKLNLELQELEKREEAQKAELEAIAKYPIPQYVSSLCVLVRKLNNIINKQVPVDADYAVLLEQYEKAKAEQEERRKQGKSADMLDYSVMDMTLDVTVHEVRKSSQEDDVNVSSTSDQLESTDDVTVAPPASTPADVQAAKGIVVSQYVQEQANLLSQGNEAISQEGSNDCGQDPLEADDSGALSQEMDESIDENNETIVEENEEEEGEGDPVVAEEGESEEVEEPEAQEFNETQQLLDEDEMEGCVDGGEEEEGQLDRTGDDDMGMDYSGQVEEQQPQNSVEAEPSADCVMGEPPSEAVCDDSDEFHTGLTQQSDVAPAFDSLQTVPHQQNANHGRSPGGNSMSSAHTGGQQAGNSPMQMQQPGGENLSDLFREGQTGEEQPAADVDDVLNISMNSNNPGGDFLSLVQGGGASPQDPLNKADDVSAPPAVSTDFSFSLFGGGGDAGSNSAGGGGDFGFDFGSASPARGGAGGDAAPSDFSFNFGGDGPPAGQDGAANGATGGGGGDFGFFGF